MVFARRVDVYAELLWCDARSHGLVHALASETRQEASTPRKRPGYPIPEEINQLLEQMERLLQLCRLLSGPATYQAAVALDEAAIQHAGYHFDPIRFERKRRSPAEWDEREFVDQAEEDRYESARERLVAEARRELLGDMEVTTTDPDAIPGDLNGP